MSAFDKRLREFWDICPSEQQESCEIGTAFFCACRAKARCAIFGHDWEPINPRRERCMKCRTERAN